MDSDYNNSDHEIDDKTHAKLVRNVLNLSSKQYVKKPTRTEPTLNISEYDLVKSGKNVQLLQLTQVLRQKGKKHGVIEKKIRKAGKKGKTLPKPLEKPQAERIRRTIGYEHTRLELDKWEPVVTANRVAQQIRFPLATKTDLKDEGNDSKWRMQSDLEKELEEIQPKVEVIEVETEKKFPMTLRELMERRKESAKMRAYQSYKEAKARRQNKIKSKKYHRVQRREKIKQQLKEFELLQKKDPRAALLKLDEIEKARAQERISLRHKGTGKWARNKQIRAKYDKESRQVLAQQLAISRDLTQKQKIDDSDSENEENENAVKITKDDPNNPWINSANIKVAKEVEDFVSGYRKYWEQKNNVNNDVEENENISKESNNEMDDVESDDEDLTDEEVGDENLLNGNLNGDISKINRKKNSDNTKESSIKNKREENVSPKRLVKQKVKIEETKNLTNNKDLKVKNIKKSKNQKTGTSKEDSSPKKVRQLKNLDGASNDLKRNENDITDIDSAKIKNKRLSGTSEWDVVDVDKELLKLDSSLQKKMQQRYNKLKKEIDRDEKLEKIAKKTKKLQTKKKKPDLSLPKKATKAIIDEELNETTYKDKNNEIDKIKTILDDAKNADKKKPQKNKKDKVEDIDPEKFRRVKKTTELQTEIPDLMAFDDNEEDVDQRDVITEAFEDDDIADDFAKEKNNDIKNNKVKDVDLTLPGWGAWGGKDIKVSTRKKRRFMMKFNKPQNRRDKNKGNLIIKEGSSAKLKPHLVSEVPFPFKTVKDYEASIRAPIGNTFVPENAHRKMIEPAIITKLGAIIEPLSENVLLRKKKR